MNKWLILCLCLITLTSYAETIGDLTPQLAQLQQAQQQLQQKIQQEAIAIQRLDVLLKHMSKISLQEPIHFAGQDYSLIDFQQQKAQLQQQLSQKQKWLTLSQPEKELLDNRITAIAWRIETLKANQGEPQ